MQDLAKEFVIVTGESQRLFRKVHAYMGVRNFPMMAQALQDALPKEDAKFLRNENELKHYMRWNFAMLGAEAEVEVQREGLERCDLQVKTGGMIFIFELKYGGKDAQAAMDQIDKKKYCKKDLEQKDPLQKKPHLVFAVGLAFFEDKPAEVKIALAFLQYGEIMFQEVGATIKS